MDIGFCYQNQKRKEWECDGSYEHYDPEGLDSEMGNSSARRSSSTTSTTWFFSSPSLFAFSLTA
ncbi:hypothetical protein CK203_006006 [Vitis vinifera]|uniref:Uncharacterized protein n=1 Tax=Vitis vinifera TaxID=29760 RepID=A0A438K6A2_VITVI|nr:hypothetical protein CK203_006006 [Vitis vinifera]